MCIFYATKSIFESVLCDSLDFIKDTEIAPYRLNWGARIYAGMPTEPVRMVSFELKL